MGIINLAKTIIRRREETNLENQFKRWGEKIHIVKNDPNRYGRWVSNKRLANLIRVIDSTESLNENLFHLSMIIVEGKSLTKLQNFWNACTENSDRIVKYGPTANTDFYVGSRDERGIPRLLDIGAVKRMWLLLKREKQSFIDLDSEIELDEENLTEAHKREDQEMKKYWERQEAEVEELRHKRALKIARRLFKLYTSYIRSFMRAHNLE